MTELFTEQAQFAKANNHVYVNGIHYDEAKAQREIKYACDFEAARGISFPMTDALFAMWLLRQVYVKQPVEVKKVEEEYLFNGKTKTRTKTYFNGIEYRDFDKAIAASDDFKEQKKLVATLLYAEEYTDRTKGVGSDKGIPYGPVAGEHEILFTPFGYYDIGTDKYYHVEGENIIEFAEDENNNEEITVTKGNKNSLLCRINPELSMETEKVYTASFSGFDNDFAENPDVSEQFNEFIDFVKDEVEKYVEDTGVHDDPYNNPFTIPEYTTKHFNFTPKFYSSEGGFNPITNGEHYKECCDLIDKPSWMSQELYDLLE